jgi:hypothetical protein
MRLEIGGALRLRAASLEKQFFKEEYHERMKGRIRHHATNMAGKKDTGQEHEKHYLTIGLIGLIVSAQCLQLTARHLWYNDGVVWFKQDILFDVIAGNIFFIIKPHLNLFSAFTADNPNIFLISPLRETTGC